MQSVTTNTVQENIYFYLALRTKIFLWEEIAEILVEIQTSFWAWKETGTEEQLGNVSARL